MQRVFFFFFSSFRSSQMIFAKVMMIGVGDFYKGSATQRPISVWISVFCFILDQYSIVIEKKGNNLLDFFSFANNLTVFT